MKDKIDKTLAGLKDFQADTVDYIIKQFDSGRTRMLIADEVGLGKTIVAKGIIARLFQKTVIDGTQNRFNVVYICSNQAIARSNIRKLNFKENDESILTSNNDDRLTALAYADYEDDPRLNFSIRAFTPATSFDDKTHAGRKDERILLYRLLFDYTEIIQYKNSLKWILKGNNRISDDTWEYEIDKAERGEGRPVRGKVSSEFRKLMENFITPETLPKCFDASKVIKPIKIWTLLKNLCQLELRKNNYDKYDFRRELISFLRLTLSRACLSFLNADVFILDEFQRYRRLIETDSQISSPAIELARAIFQMKNCKILMLSATPFKAFTTDFDELNGEVHHEEFEMVLRFLNADLGESDWVNLKRNKSEMFSYLRHTQKITQEIDKVKSIKNALESFYRQCMVRTERLTVSKEKDSLIKSMLKDYIDPEMRDIDDFIALDQITKYINNQHKKRLPIPLEYVKSSPYALSFLEGYQHRRLLMDLTSGDESLKKMLKELKHGWLNLKAVSKYQPVADQIPNGKLRLLLDETIHKGAWKLLWIPPAMPYYEFGYPFNELKDFTKVLVFSSWVLVPRMISTMVSYESERMCVGDPDSISRRENEEEKREYFAKKRHPRPQIVYRIDKEDGESSLSQPLNIIYLYPSIFLSAIIDPQDYVTNPVSLKDILSQLKIKIAQYLISPEVQKYAKGNGDIKTWYWAAPLILDKVIKGNDVDVIAEWIEKGLPQSETVTDSEEEAPQREETSGKSKYFTRIRDIFNNPCEVDLPPLTESKAMNIAEYLATLALASPSICYLRTQLRYSENLTTQLLDNSFDVASAFVSYFNKPESISIIRLCTKHLETASYLDRVMEYSLAGNIQAMLDEYLYLVRELEGLYGMDEISTHLSDILSIRSTTTKIDDLNSFLKSTVSDTEVRSTGMRTHFAMDFAGQKLSTAKTSGRQINIRQAFNSPFRPFVLATTSIGQEGLDFHLYCRKIFHWNLPANAIDIEQREGRINRYKGLVIRQNLVEKYSSYISSKKNLNIWDELFKIAEQKEGKGAGMCEMVPFWHTEPVSDLKIERFVPLYSFSKDINKYNELMKILVYYRLTFGQPRQEELINALSSIEDENIKNDIYELLIDLSPMRFNNA